MLEAIYIGTMTALHPAMLVAVLFGVIFGLFIGMLPGLTSTMGVALLIPVTFSLPPEVGLAMLGGIYCASTFSGSISAILLNIPGTPSAVATMQDGFPMTQRGEAGRAIGLSVYASSIGGLFSVVVLLFLAPVLSELSLMIGTREYFLLALFGVTIIATLSSGDLFKGLMGGILGLVISVVGMHPMTGEMRLTFGLPALYDGLPVVIALIGLYSVPEVISILGGRRASDESARSTSFAGAMNTLRDVLRQGTNVLRSSIIGTFIGIVPGAGQSIASFIAYDAAKRSSKDPGRFGKGSEEGLVAAETANNAVTGGSLVPLMTLGIPGNAVAAVLMGGLIIHGLAPGPALFTGTPEVAYGFIISLAVANLMFVPLGLIVARYCFRAIMLPKDVLAVTILALAVVGSFAIRGQLFDVALMLGVGLLGYVFALLSISRAPLVLGLVLGSMAESNLSRALMLVRGDPWELLFQLLTRPFSAGLILLCVISILFGMRKSTKADI